MKTKIGIIGGGNMGGAIIAGISKQFSVSVCEQDQKRCQQLKRKYKVPTGDLRAIVERSHAVIIAVKPQNFEKLLKQIRPFVTKDKLIISIAAGITCRFIEKVLGRKAHVVRTMPNLPVLVGCGITGICSGKSAVSKDLLLARRIFSCIGKAVVVEEKWMDAITAVSGSGPAYVFQFIEQFNNAARSLGLDKNLANELVLQTIQGSLNLLEQDKKDAGQLRVQVTSKGGTTQAALDVFRKKRSENIFKSALSAAKKRAKELSK